MMMYEYVPKQRISHKLDIMTSSFALTRCIGFFANFMQSLYLPETCFVTLSLEISYNHYMRLKSALLYYGDTKRLQRSEITNDV